jgi:hypothetical protein
VEERDGLCETAWGSAAKLLEKISIEVKALGVRAVFHHHAGTYFETPSEIERLLSITDPSLLGLCLDTGHYFYGGGDPVKPAHKRRAFGIFILRTFEETCWIVFVRRIPASSMLLAMAFFESADQPMLLELATKPEF